MFDQFIALFDDTPFKIIVNSILMAVIAYFVYRWVLEPIYTSFVGMRNFWKLRNRPAAYLEITPPEHSEKSPLATRQLFAILQSLIGKNEVMPLEIDGSHEEGTRYLIRTHPADIPALQRDIASYLPEAQFRVLETQSIPEEITGEYSRVFEIKQSRHYAGATRLSIISCVILY